MRVSPPHYADKSTKRCIQRANASPGSYFDSKDRGCIRAGIDPPLKNGHDEIRTLRKMTVYSAKADARPFRNLTDGSIHSGRQDGRRYSRAILLSGYKCTQRFVDDYEDIRIYLLQTCVEVRR